VHVGKVLKRLRLRKEPRMTQEALASSVGVHSVTLSRIERGVHNPDIATLEALAKGLGTTAAAILDAAARDDIDWEPDGKPSEVAS
jgi:transcriptional regulator with XRE-family HTH domain